MLAKEKQRKRKQSCAGWRVQAHQGLGDVSSKGVLLEDIQEQPVGCERSGGDAVVTVEHLRGWS